MKYSKPVIPEEITTLLFDLDGVVVFTDKYHYLAWKKLSDENGWDFNEAVNDQCRGIPRMASLQVILDHNQIDLPQEEKERLAAVKNAYYVRLLENINSEDLYPGIIPFMEKLKSKAFKLAICSSSKNADLVLDKLKISHFFDAVITGADIQNAKPDPEIFLLGAKRTESAIHECLVFEDAPSGVEAAHRAGMKCIGVGSPDLLPMAETTIQTYEEIDIKNLSIKKIETP